MKTSLKVAACIGALAVAAAGAYFIYAFDPVAARFYPRCLFHQLTGLDCPGCGTARALHAFAHGRILEGLRSNPALIPLLCWAAILLLRPALARSPRVAWGTLAAIVLYTILRNLP